MCLANVCYALSVLSMLLCLSTKEDIPFNSKHTHTPTHTRAHTLVLELSASTAPYSYCSDCAKGLNYFIALIGRCQS